MKILIVIPTYNEEKILKDNILKLFDYCQKNLTDDWKIVIADNKSSDKTPVIGKSLASQFSKINYLYVNRQGKGVAIKTAWQKYEVDIYCFMDADLAADLSALLPLIQGIKVGNDVIAGSRFHPQSQVKRSILRLIFSHGYRLALRILLGLKLSDAPCGFKAINNKVKESVLNQVQDESWFFDSELVILAEKKRYKLKEIPVNWHDPRGKGDRSKVKVLALSLAYLKEIIKLKKRL